MTEDTIFGWQNGFSWLNAGGYLLKIQGGVYILGRRGIIFALKEEKGLFSQIYRK